MDISLYHDAVGIERVAIIELKKSGKEIVSDKYRGEKKPVITSEFGKALSQIIHYIEDKRTRTRVVEGVLIIGRKRDVKDWFIEKFNTYLHGIRVMTYDDVIENATNTLKMLRQLEFERTSHTDFDSGNTSEGQPQNPSPVQEDLNLHKPVGVETSQPDIAGGMNQAVDAHLAPKEPIHE